VEAEASVAAAAAAYLFIHRIYGASQERKEEEAEATLLSCILFQVPFFSSGLFSSARAAPTSACGRRRAAATGVARFTLSSKHLGYADIYWWTMLKQTKRSLAQLDHIFVGLIRDIEFRHQSPNKVIYGTRLVQSWLYIRRFAL
jgi:hypothetical protein